MARWELITGDILERMVNVPQAFLLMLRKQLRRYEWAHRIYSSYKTEHIRLIIRNRNFAVDRFPERDANRVESASG